MYKCSCSTFQCGKRKQNTYLKEDHNSHIYSQVASPKGMAQGALNVIIDSTNSVLSFQDHPQMICIWARFRIKINQPIKAVVVVEKEAIFKRILEQKILLEKLVGGNVIILTVSLKYFLKTLSN